MNAVMFSESPALECTLGNSLFGLKGANTKPYQSLFIISYCSFIYSTLNISIILPVQVPGKLEGIKV